MTIAGVALSFLLVSPALAQPEAPTGEVPRIEYAKRTVLNIDDPLSVEGKLIGPHGVVVTEPVRMKFNPLIRLRDSFTDRMSNSITEVR